MRICERVSDFSDFSFDMSVMNNELSDFFLPVFTPFYSMVSLSHSNSIPTIFNNTKKEQKIWNAFDDFHCRFLLSQFSSSSAFLFCE